VARAIAKFPVPIITGIGHQKNETLADLMAHTATKTPTQAAEFILHHNRLFERRLLVLRQDIVLQSQVFVSASSRQLTMLNGRILNRTRDFLQLQERQLFMAKARFSRAATALAYHQQQLLQQMQLTVLKAGKASFTAEKHQLQRQEEKVRAWSSLTLKNAQTQIRHIKSSISLMSPSRILQKGFAVLKVEGKIMTDPTQLSVGQSIEIVTSQISLDAIIQQKKESQDGAGFNL